MIIDIPKKEEYEKVNELAREVHKLHSNWRPDLFLDVEEVIKLEAYNEMISNNEIFVAKLDEEIVGYIVFKICEKGQSHVMRKRHQLTIEAMCVSEKHRGKGIGTSLLNYAKEFAIKNNCTDIYLTVNEENKGAIKAYEKFGMKVMNIAYSMQLDK